MQKKTRKGKKEREGINKSIYSTFKRTEEKERPIGPKERRVAIMNKRSRRERETGSLSGHREMQGKREQEDERAGPV